MSPCEKHLLGPLHDGELPAAEQMRVARHVAECEDCATELEAIRNASRLLKDFAFDDLTGVELSRIHSAVDQSESQPLLRLIGGLCAVAASVLIISCAWLIELPADNAGTAHQVATRRAEPWEQVATSLRPDPFSLNPDDGIRFADADLANWMLAGLTERTLP